MARAKRPDPIKAMIKEALYRNDLNQSDLARAMQVTPQAVSAMLRNTGSISVNHLRVVALATGTKLVIRLEEAQ